jgi:hypothetical protein
LERRLPEIDREELMRLRKVKYILIPALIAMPLAVVLAAYEKSHHPDPLIVPAQTALYVRLNQALASDRNERGDRFEATVSEGIVIDNKTAIPQGAQVEGAVVDARHLGKLTGRARLRLVPETVAVNGTTYEIRTLIAGPLGAGTTVAALPGEKDIRLPAETALTFWIAEPITLNGGGQSPPR